MLYLGGGRKSCYNNDGEYETGIFFMTGNRNVWAFQAMPEAGKSTATALLSLNPS